MEKDSPSIADRVDSFPEPWKPNVGDKLVGEVTEVGTRLSEYGDYPLVGVMTESGDELVFHAFHTVAKNELARQRPKVGDQIAVKYFGRDDDRGYERYRVLVIHPHTAREGAGPDWDAMAAESENELESGDDPGAWPEGAEIAGA